MKMMHEIEINIGKLGIELAVSPSAAFNLILNMAFASGQEFPRKLAREAAASEFPDVVQVLVLFLEQTAYEIRKARKQDQEK